MARSRENPDVLLASQLRASMQRGHAERVAPDRVTGPKARPGSNVVVFNVPHGPGARDHVLPTAPLQVCPVAPAGCAT